MKSQTACWICFFIGMAGMGAIWYTSDHFPDTGNMIPDKHDTRTREITANRGSYHAAAKDSIVTLQHKIDSLSKLTNDKTKFVQNIRAIAVVPYDSNRILFAAELDTLYARFIADTSTGDRR